MRFFQVKKKVAQLFFCFLLLTFNSYGQENQEIVFEKAKTMASNANYNEAITLVNQLILQYPNNLDYKLYLAQLHYWSNNNLSSKKELQEILKQNTNYQDAFDLLIKVEFLLENYDEVIHKSQEGKNKFLVNKDFYNFQEALALEKQDKNREALLILASIDENSKQKNNAKYLETQILKKSKNTISIGYSLTDFENSASALNITNLEYGRKVSKNTFIGRINYGTTSFNSNPQAEVDAYLKSKTKGYLYLNSGFSGKNIIFPQYKFGAEYFQDFKKISSSLGGRYLSFDTKNNALLFTGHLGLNLEKWKIEYRHYLAETNKNWFSSSILNFRRNFETTESYIQFDFQYGSLPYFFTNSEIFQRLSAYRFGLNSKIRIQKNYFIQPVFMLEREEYIPNEFRNRYTMQLILSTRF